MRILFVSALPKTMSGGPKYSVPRQVNAQAQFDEVFWINLSPWGPEKSEIRCENITGIERCIERISECCPDIVIFEDLYYLDFYRIGRALSKKEVPYIIVPRGCLTLAAQKQKWYKKIPANILLFLPFTKKALAIEYLTQREADNSGKFWNKRSIIVPNGVDFPPQKAAIFSTKGVIRGTFIGRINPYHKGLDIFFEACEKQKMLLEEKNCKLDFYGPFSENVGKKVEYDIRRRGLESIVSIHKEVHGTNKEQILLNTDFFILTSRFEGLPMGLLEATAYGLPSIVTDETNIGELIQKSGAGLSSKCTVHGVQQNLEKLLTMEEDDLNEMSQKAVIFAKSFDWTKIAMEAHAAYEDLLKKDTK